MRYWGAAFLMTIAGCQPQAQHASKVAQLSYEGAGAPTQATKVAHGRRLTQVLGCTGCHGGDFQGKDMANKPGDGAMYSPNVTLLAGRYSDADIERLFREGVPKDDREFWFMQVE